MATSRESCFCKTQNKGTEKWESQRHHKGKQIQTKTRSGNEMQTPRRRKRLAWWSAAAHQHVQTSRADAGGHQALTPDTRWGAWRSHGPFGPGHSRWLSSREPQPRWVGRHRSVGPICCPTLPLPPVRADLSQHQASGLQPAFHGHLNPIGS